MDLPPTRPEATSATEEPFLRIYDTVCSATTIIEDYNQESHEFRLPALMFASFFSLLSTFFVLFSFSL
jgi:hypothetical protein